MSYWENQSQILLSYWSKFKHKLICIEKKRLLNLRLPFRNNLQISWEFINLDRFYKYFNPIFSLVACLNTCASSPNSLIIVYAETTEVCKMALWFEGMRWGWLIPILHPRHCNRPVVFMKVHFNFHTNFISWGTSIENDWYW